jgi:hypothetical protein
MEGEELPWSQGQGSTLKLQTSNTIWSDYVALSNHTTAGISSNQSNVTAHILFKSSDKVHPCKCWRPAYLRRRVVTQTVDAIRSFLPVICTRCSYDSLTLGLEWLEWLIILKWESDSSNISDSRDALVTNQRQWDWGSKGFDSIGRCSRGRFWLLCPGWWEYNMVQLRSLLRHYGYYKWVLFRPSQTALNIPVVEELALIGVNDFGTPSRCELFLVTSQVTSTSLPLHVGNRSRIVLV